MAFICGLWCAAEDIPEEMMPVVKTAWFRCYGDLTVPEWIR